jgi:hypothetical protein
MQEIPQMEIQTQPPELVTVSRHFRRVDAARYLRETYGIPCAPATLAKKAVVGGGPAYKLAGKFPIYAQDDLDAWAKSRLSERVSSTSELSRRQAETAY